MAELHEHEHSHGHDHDHVQTERHVNIPVMLLGLAVAIIFGIAVFSYQVGTTERAIVLTLGKINEKIVQPGLHFRWPMPVQKVVKYDIRLRCYEGSVGKLEETPTSDGKNITMSVFAVYKIDDLPRFQRAGGNIDAAEEALSSLMRTAKGAIVGKYRFDQLVNSDPKKIRIPDMEKDMLQYIAPKISDQYGLTVRHVYIKQIGVPDKPAKAIAERMVSERKAEAAKYKEQGNVESQKIRTKADADRRTVITRAEAQAKQIRAAGDAAAAQHYAIFAKDPELAAFLRKLESMKRLMGTRTTLILDTNTAPFDILKSGSPEFKSAPVK